MATNKSEQTDSDELAIDLDDLTFREQIELRKLVRELVGEDDMEDPPVSAVIPVAYYILKRRTDAEFTLDQALDMKWEDVRKRPTKARKARAASGNRASSSKQG